MESCQPVRFEGDYKSANRNCLALQPDQNPPTSPERLSKTWSTIQQPVLNNQAYDRVVSVSDQVDAYPPLVNAPYLVHLSSSIFYQPPPSESFKLAQDGLYHGPYVVSPSTPEVESSIFPIVAEELPILA